MKVSPGGSFTPLCSYCTLCHIRDAVYAMLYMWHHMWHHIHSTVYTVLHMQCCICSAAYMMPYMQCSIHDTIYTMPYMQGETGWGECGGSKGNKAPESDWSPKAADCLQRLPRLPEVPGRSQLPRETQEVREKKGVRGQGEWGLCLTRYMSPHHLCRGKGWREQGEPGGMLY